MGQYIYINKYNIILNEYISSSEPISRKNGVFQNRLINNYSGFKSSTVESKGYNKIYLIYFGGSYGI